MIEPYQVCWVEEPCQRLARDCVPPQSSPMRLAAMGRLQGWADSPIIPLTFRWQRGPAKGVVVRLLLGVAVIAVGVANLCFQHRWHRVLGVVAIVIGLTLCALVWFR